MFKLSDSIVMFLAPAAKRGQIIEFLSLGLLGLERFAHTVSDRAFVEGLIRLNRHFDFVTNPNEQEAPLSAVDG